MSAASRSRETSPIIRAWALIAATLYQPRHPLERRMGELDQVGAAERLRSRRRVAGDQDIGKPAHRVLPRGRRRCPH